MKRILIVNNNMKIGGVQKSLYNLLWAIDGKYDITLCLFRATGVYMDKLPASVKVISVRGLFRYLGSSQAESRGLKDRLLRGGLAFLCHKLGRPAVMKLMLPLQKKLPETYDCAIAYLQNGNITSFYGGVQEFVIKKVRASKKIAFLHGDYENAGGKCAGNDRVLERFDRVAACSDGCRAAFCRALPSMATRCRTVRNCHRFSEISALAAENPMSYGENCRNVLMVSRLAHEKGIERAIQAVHYCIGQGVPVKLHLVGGGGMMDALKALVSELSLEEHVVFYGEQGNPYRFMPGADFLLLTSYHEAAPMVIEEARTLELPTMTTQTSSSAEMITARCAGWVCENAQTAINETLLRVLQDVDGLRRMKQTLRVQTVDNTDALRQFTDLIEE